MPGRCCCPPTALPRQPSSGPPAAESGQGDKHGPPPARSPRALRSLLSGLGERGVWGPTMPLRTGLRASGGLSYLRPGSPPQVGPLLRVLWTPELHLDSLKPHKPRGCSLRTFWVCVDDRLLRGQQAAHHPSDGARRCGPGQWCWRSPLACLWVL